MRLTKHLIEAAKYQGNGQSRFIIWDMLLAGFGLRVYPSGKKTFVLQYTYQGRRRLLTLGAYGPLTIDMARDQATRDLAHIIEGKDPLKAKEQSYREKTVKEICHDYLERHAKVHKKTWLEDQRRIQNHILRKWSTYKISAVSPEDAAKLHHELTMLGTPYEANRLLELVSTIFNLARRWGYYEGRNPAQGIQNNKEKKRDRWLTPEELPRVAEAINQEESVFARAAIWFYLFTGVRKSELLKAKWEDIDMQRKELRLGDTKAGRTHYVPLSSPALKILEELPRLSDNPYIIPGAKAGEHWVELKKVWERIRTRAKVEDVHLHDLRRTVGSWLAQSGSSLHLIGRVLNHSSTSTTAIYARFAQDHVREALENHAQRLLAVIKQSPTNPPTPEANQDLGTYQLKRIK